MATSPTLTPAFLAGVDVLLIGSPMTGAIGITPLSAAEQTALVNVALFAFFSQHETLFLNTLDYLGVPESSGGALAGIAGGVVGIGRTARSFRRKVRLRAFKR